SWWPMRAHGPTSDRVREVARMVRLDGRLDVPTSQMSHGEQRQLEIALAIATEPRVLLLDEPAAGLTAAEREALRELVSDLPAEMSVLLIEHDMEMALGLVDRVLCLADGRPVALGTPE